MGTMKLTKEEKIRYVKAYNAGEIINTPEGFYSRSAFKNSLLNWVKRYNSEGEKGLDRRPPRIATNDEKIAIVERIRRGERNVDVAKETGFSSGAITNWCRDYSILLENRVKCNAKEDITMPDKEKKMTCENTPDAEIERLRAENEQLKAEVAVLKKSVALKVMKARQQRRQKPSGNCCRTIKADID